MDRIEQDSPADLRRKLGKRLALAAVLILVLLGALAVFDYVSELERDEANKPVAAVQPRVGRSISSPRPITPADQQITPPASLEPKELPAGAEPPPKPEIAAQAATPTPIAPVAPPAAAPSAVPPAVSRAVPPAAAPAVPPAGAPSVTPIAGAPVAAKPPAPVAPRPIAAAPSPAAAKAPIGAVPPAVPAAAVTLPTAPSVAVVPEETSGAPLVGAPPAARLPQPAAASAAATNQSVLARLAAGFVLQAGVFTSTERAEELRAKLVMAGVPVVVESRVQVGPFASQKEAQAARKKIRELGVDSIIIPPRGGRR